jgi:hypothetical protein
MTEKLSNLQELREELVERRREEAQALTTQARGVDPLDRVERMKVLGQLHLAIEAVDAILCIQRAAPPASRT